MRVAVIGAGAIGCVTGAMLSEKGHQVTLVGRPDMVSAVNNNGLVIESAAGAKTYELASWTSIDFEPEAAIFAVKTQDMEKAAREAQPLLKDALIVTMQNGVMSDEIAASVLGKCNIVSSVVMFGATYIEPGRVTYNFPGSLIIGRAFDSGSGRDIVNEATALLDCAFDVTLSDDIHGVHWTKLILNLNNAVACVLGMSLQETFEDPRLCRLGVMLMKEAYETMEKAGIRLGSLPDLPLDKLRSLLGAPLEVSSGVYGNIMKGLSKEPLPGSVLQSIRRGKATEVDYLNGEIAVLGMKHRFPACINKKMVELVKRVEECGRFISREELLKETGI
jgi:2-dehydropantoate 2-reductase